MADKYQDFLKTLCFCGKRCGFFELFFGDKSDCIDVWFIKITIEPNQIDMNVCFFQKVDNIQNHVCPMFVARSFNPSFNKGEGEGEGGSSRPPKVFLHNF